MRTFLAAEVPKHVRKKIDNFTQEERKKDLPIKWVSFENLHITLKFLGEIDEKKMEQIVPVIAEISKHHAPFKVRLEGLGCFPGPRNPRVLWVGVTEGAETLGRLACELEEGLSQFDFRKEKRFHAHLTIGRIKKFCKIDDILSKSIATDTFGVEAITLFKSTLMSEGPLYEELKKFTLGQSG